MSTKAIGKQLEKLALEIIEKAHSDQVPFPDKLEAFKIVSGYHVGLTRAEKGRDDKEPEDTFEKMRSGLRAVGGKDG